jgi:hypothetical protein
MKLLPHIFKWIGLTIFLIGFVVSMIDEGRHGFIDGWNEGRESGTEEIVFVRIMPEFISQLADYATMLGLLIYILAKNKREDEFAQKLRYESAFIVLVVSILFVFILYVADSDIQLSPSSVLTFQMLFYLIVRVIKKYLILE